MSGSVGIDSVASIWQWVAPTSQDVLQRIGSGFDALTGRYVTVRLAGRRA
jgi:hypothetical protein